MRLGIATSLSSALLVAATSAQTLLYDNDTIVTHPGGGVGGMDGSALDNTPTFHTPHNVFGFTSTGTFSLADDFTVCGTWTVSHIEVYGYLTGAIPPTVTGMVAQIWNGDPRTGGSVIWGNLTTNLVTGGPIGTHVANRALIGVIGTDQQRRVQAIRVAVPAATPLVLSPGTYWLHFQYTGVNFTPPTSENEVNDTGNGIQFNGSTWAVLNNAIAPNVAGCGVPFKFFGTAVNQTVAVAAAFGAGKSGTNGIASWDLGTPVRHPVLGRDYRLRIINGLSGSSPLVFIGTPFAAGVPVPPFGTLHVLPVITTLSMPAFNANNVSSLRLPVPHGSNLCGLVLGWQAFWGDPGATGSVCHTNGLELTLGN
jgi:hypothetical protein